MKPSPNVVMTVCRDEEDVVTAFVLFYLASGFDQVQIVDNASTDSTVEQIETLIADGLPVRLIHDHRPGYERYLTEHFHAVGRTTGADWLFFLDVDEFILFPRPARDYLSALPDEINCLCLHQKEMYPEFDHRDRNTVGNHFAGFLLTHRSEPETNDTTKDIARYRPDARVRAGKHRIDFVGSSVHAPDDLIIRHYKYRTQQQARRKEVNRVADQANYSETDLAEISAFGVARSRAWFDECIRSAEREEWQRSFSRDVRFTEDRELADWARRSLMGGRPAAMPRPAL